MTEAGTCTILPLPIVRIGGSLTTMRLVPALALVCLSAGILHTSPAVAICIGDGEYELAMAQMYARDAKRLKEAKARARGQTLIPPPSPPQTRITAWPDFGGPRNAEVARLSAH